MNTRETTYNKPRQLSLYPVSLLFLQSFIQVSEKEIRGLTLGSPQCHLERSQDNETFNAPAFGRLVGNAVTVVGLPLRVCHFLNKIFPNKLSRVIALPTYQ